MSKIYASLALVALILAATAAFTTPVSQLATEVAAVGAADSCCPDGVCCEGTATSQVTNDSCCPDGGCCPICCPDSACCPASACCADSAAAKVSKAKDSCSSCPVCPGL